MKTSMHLKKLRPSLMVAILGLLLGQLSAAPVISQVQFPSQVGKYSKFEVTFQIGSSVAQNVQWPYDVSPPAGVPAGTGISVDVLFSPDNWTTTYAQPAFYYQQFLDETRDGKPWFYPTGGFSWNGRFSPNKAGTWQFKIRAQDAGGSSESGPQTFAVTESPHPGFVRVSSRDSRYFEHDDGSHFVGLGYQASNLTETGFRTMQQNGIQLVRMWWTADSIFGSQWNPYVESRNSYLGYLPRTGLFAFTDNLTGQTSIKMRIDYEPAGNTDWFDGCRTLGVWGTPVEVKPNTDYRIKVTYRGFNITGPRNAAYPKYGFVVKTGGQVNTSFEAGSGTVLTNHGLDTPTSWGTLDGSWNSGGYNFLPYFFFVMENVTSGEVYVDTISMREDLGGGNYGPEIVHKPSMEHQNYFQQHSSYLIDKVVMWAEQYGVYLKPVILEKAEKIMRKIGFDGSFAGDNDAFFYGDYRNVTKVRWLQQAWWRYLQARWGYSPNIHSWELCNEGDPVSDRHFTMTDEMGKFFHSRVFGVPVGNGDGAKAAYSHPNAHMVTTSFWHSLPSDLFWANTRFPNVDYADVHAYISTGWQHNPAHETDAALYHLDYSADCRSNLDYFSAQRSLKTKPVIRGEAGIDRVTAQIENPDLARDVQGTWLHNYLWAGLDPGALHELYWWPNNRENQPGPDGQRGLHEIYRTCFDFLRTLPVNNGHYQDLQAGSSSQALRVVGQKDLVNGNAHLWIQNKQHTWRNVIDNVSISPASGTITLDGFSANSDYKVEWWNTYQLIVPGVSFRTDVVKASSTGMLTIPVAPLVTDVAAKVVKANGSTPPTAPTGLSVTDIKP